MNKSVKFILILLVLIAYKGVFTQLSLHDTLMLEVEKLAAILPEGTIYDIVISMTPNGEFFSKSFAISTLSESISSLNIPSEAKNKLMGIAYTNSVVFKSFSLTLQSGDSSYYEIVGACRVINETAEIAYVAVTVNAQLAICPTKKYGFSLDCPMRYCEHCLASIDSQLKEQLYGLFRYYGFENLKEEMNKLKTNYSLVFLQENVIKEKFLS